MFWQGEFAQQSRAFFVSDHFLYSYDNNDNLEIILEGEISCMSLFWVWRLEKVNVQMTENLVCLAFLFTLQQDVSKIGILKDLSCTYFLWCMYFCCRQRKLKCKDLKRENNCTFCSKVQNQKMSQGTHSGIKNVRRHLGLWKLKKNVMEAPVLILNAVIFMAFYLFCLFRKS